MKYYISTIADVTTEETDGDWEKLAYVKRTAPLAKENGLGIELAEFCISDNMDITYDDVLPHAEYNASMAEEKTLHAPYNELFPMAIDRKVVEVAWNRYDETIKLCEHFRAKKMIVHANYFENMYYPGWFVSRHVDFWKRFLAQHPQDIEICIENVADNYPDLLLQIVKTVDDPRLRMCIDVGHANLGGTSPFDWVRQCAPYISHYHLHNNNGPAKEGPRSSGDLHRSLGDGIIDMKALIALCEELTPNATAAVESYWPEDSVQWLKDNGMI